MVSFTHEQNIICTQTQLDDIAHEQTIICWQLFAGHVMGLWPIKRKKNLHRMIIFSVSRPQYFISYAKSQRSPVTRHRLYLHSTLVA